MGILLRDLLVLLLDIMRGMVEPFVLAIVGAMAVAALLRLATFPWRRDVVRVILTWLLLGVLSAFVHSVLMLIFPSLESKSLLVNFLVYLVIGPVLPLLLPHSPTNQWFRPWTIYVAWVYVWLTIIIGWRHGWLGLLTITLPAFITAELGLLFVAGFLLPFPEKDLHRRRPVEECLIPTFDQDIKEAFALLSYPENREILKKRIEEHRTALRCLLTYTLGTNYPYHVVVDEKINERTLGDREWLTDEERLVKRANGDNFGDFLSGPGIVLTGCDHAVVLSSGLKFKGAKGPGIVFTGMSDSPTQVIDLRVQLRAFPVEAWTKDGIAIRVVTFIPFQIGSGQEEPRLGKGFPYRSSDIFKAVHAQMMEHEDLSQTPENLKQHRWYDLPQIAGERIMREIISHYEFDELYAPFELYADPNQHPRSKIVQELRDELDKILPDWGIQRIGGGISNLMPMDEQVIEQRIEAWRADSAREIMLKQAAGQSRRLHLVEQARAQAQVDIILNVGNRIEGLREIGADGFARYFIEILEELVKSSTLRRLLPRDTEDILERTRMGLNQSV